MIVRRAEELSVEEVLARPGMVVVVADGDVTAAALLADWLVIGSGARLAFHGFRSRGEGTDSKPAGSAPEVHAPNGALIGALVWRIGSKALRLYAMSGSSAGANDLVSWGVADALVPCGEDSVEWVAGWIGGRSSLALDAAAALVRGRGGDELERAEFARLFAIGEPQIGLSAFLARRRKGMRDEG